MDIHKIIYKKLIEKLLEIDKTNIKIIYLRNQVNLEIEIEIEDKEINNIWVLEIIYKFLVIICLKIL
jgi:hypothetical protein